ncbi:MAG: hypothetical protein K9W44_05735 [Candidatus Lokiarchaeota archaeon]|nr:hypothetical protein [Candidatus Harpocratesius repetitus]
MTLDWTFSFVSSKQIDNPKIEHICSFRDGKIQFIADPKKNPEIISQLEPVILLINYIAYFPNKDFTKIKLKTSGSQFAIHFLDKRFLEHNFLGILSVSEFDEIQPFESWGVEELMAEFVFDNFLEMKQESTDKGFDILKFEEWLKPEIFNFYQDWVEAKHDEILTKKETRTFRESKIHSLNYKKYEQWWDLQIINEFGNPITDLISFIDDQAFMINSNVEKIEQNLEGMSLSALKILIDTQGAWDILYLKNRLKNEMGYQYVFFEHFIVSHIKYLIILNTALYDVANEKCIQAFRGFEFDMLKGLAEKLVQHPDFFNPQGQIRPENIGLTHRIIITSIQQYLG